MAAQTIAAAENANPMPAYREMDTKPPPNAGIDRRKENGLARRAGLIARRSSKFPDVVTSSIKSREAFLLGAGQRTQQLACFRPCGAGLRQIFQQPAGGIGLGARQLLRH